MRQMKKARKGKGKGKARVGTAHELQHFIAMRQKKVARVGAVRAGIPLRPGGFALLLAFGQRSVRWNSVKGEREKKPGGKERNSKIPKK